MPFCAECGSSTTTGDPYCGECGALQDSAPSGGPITGTGKISSMSGSGNTPTGIQLAAGTVLVDRYKIVRRIGGGGMGSVYMAEDLNLANRPVAVKEMIEMFADESTRHKAIEDFKREAEMLARLDHPSIPTIYQYFFDQTRGRYYLVMKYIDGGDLARRQRESGGRVFELTVTRWAIDTCDVLDYIHSQRPPIIYRDLKPANLMLDGRTNRIMLVDFGIARFVAPMQKGVTAVGTMGYAPPELFSGNVEVRSDIYSLGATIFHLLTGVDPQDNPLLIFDFSKNPRPRHINPAISTQMEELICRAVEHKPEKRFTTAKSFGKELQAHLKFLTESMPADMPADPDPLPIEVAGTGANSAANSTGGPTNPGNPEAASAAEAVCGSCGQELTPDDLFCAFCGVRVRGSKRTSPRLVVLGTSEMSAQFVVTTSGESLIGRMDPNRGIRPEVDLSKYDPAARVSRRHARIIAHGGQFFIEDLGSANGTILNGTVRLIQGKPQILNAGDELKLGETTLKFLAGGKA
jgi:serine/threonine protein kinase